jgi:hypothetical protein
MAGAPSTWTFASAVELDPTVLDGSMKHHVPLPEDAPAELAVGVRVAGTLAGTRFSRVVATSGDGRRTLRFGEGWLRDVQLGPGDPVAVELDLGADPDHVDVPEELAEALEADPQLQHLWESLTPGRRRTLAYPVDRAKRPETRRRRVEAVVAELRALA